MPSKLLSSGNIAFVLSLFSLPFPSPAQPIDTPSAPRFLGSTSCASSGCHGAGGSVRHQYRTWSRRDYHSRAHATLFSARSARLAEALDIASPSISARCTVCHAPFQTVPSARLGEAVRVSEGVSCESCHGAGENWLRSHTRTDLGPEQKIAIGMRALSTSLERANSCVRCHLHIDPTLAEAGHPWLQFDLNRQLASMPPHWQGGVGDPFVNWATGELVALREMSWHLLNDAAGSRRHLEEWKASLWLLNATDLPDLAPELPDTPSTELLNRVMTAANRQASRLAVDLPSAGGEKSARRRSEDNWTRLVAAGRRLGGIEKTLQPTAARNLTRSLRALAPAVWPGGTPADSEDALAAMTEATRYPVAFDAVAYAALLAGLQP